MGLFSLFFHHDGHLDGHARQAAIRAASHATSNLDIELAQRAHILWRNRLEAAIERRPTHNLDSDTACDDHCCALGKWIHGDGEEHLSHYVTFRELRDTHQRFHDVAAEILVMAEIGHRKDAEYLLHGEFSRLSRSISQRLQDLKALT